jgi:hypothetical protein
VVVIFWGNGSSPFEIEHVVLEKGKPDGPHLKVDALDNNNSILVK